MKIQFNRKSLAIKIVTISLSMIFILMIVGMILLNYMGKVSTERTIGLFGEESVVNALNYVDMDIYAKFLQDPKDDDIYTTLKGSLNDYREKTDSLYVYTLLTEGNQTYVMINGQPDDSNNQTSIKEETTTYSEETLQRVLDGEVISTDIVENKDYGKFLTALAPMEDDAGNVIGILAVDISADKITDITDNVMKKVLPIVITIFILIFIVTSAVLLRYVLKQLQPLTTIKDIAELISAGDLKTANEKITVLPKNRIDEVGQLSHSFDEMVRELESVMTQVSTTAELVAASSEELFASADHSLEMNRQIETLIENLAEGAQTQYNYAEQSVTNMHEMSQGIETIAEASVNVTDTSMTVLEEAQAGHETIKKVVTQMYAINETNGDIERVIHRLVTQSKRIEEILNAITDIAEQTNLLALNAAIEAARAGEHGRGFAIVAEEVRNLADESKHSVKEISQLINSIHIDIEEAVTTMAKGKEESDAGIQVATHTTKAIEEILSSIQRVANEIQDVSASTQQMAASTEQVNALISQVEKIAQNVSTQTAEAVSSTEGQSNAMEDVSSASHDLSKVGQELQDMLHKFKL